MIQLSDDTTHGCPHDGSSDEGLAVRVPVAAAPPPSSSSHLEEEIITKRASPDGRPPYAKADPTQTVDCQVAFIAFIAFMASYRGATTTAASNRTFLWEAGGRVCLVTGSRSIVPLK